MSKERGYYITNGEWTSRRYLYYSNADSARNTLAASYPDTDCWIYFHEPCRTSRNAEKKLEKEVKRVVQRFVDKEADPKGIDVHAPGAKLDDGKPRVELLQDFGLALLEVAKVATFGAAKYSDGGWIEVDDGINRYTGALGRHLLEEKYCPVNEKDGGMLHAAQIAWNALARLELMLRNS